MELEKIRNLSDEELAHQEKVTSEQLFRIRFQVSLQPNEGVRKLQQLRKEIARIKTVARERQLGIRGAALDAAVAADDKTGNTKGAR
ncbi:MAG: 50S ribosomal protein L29 [Terracidiphilus sp.]|jgi:large subunit ribosomal protein L29